jgi:transcription elongation factor Elf1
MSSCPKCGSKDWDHANVGLIGAIVCTNCGEIYMMEDKTTMKTYNVYVEDTNGNYMDDYTLEANNEDHAYDLAYERHNYAPVTVYIDDEKPSTMLQDTYFGGVNPLDSFPTLKGN